jgi:carbon-monoxide dehydrogenase medium subunit
VHRRVAGIKVDGSSVTIGAMTTHAAVNASKDLAKAIPALALLAGSIGDPMVRNMGTIGGSIANNDPAADYPAAIVGLGATVAHEQTQDRSRSVFSRGCMKPPSKPARSSPRFPFRCRNEPAT